MQELRRDPQEYIDANAEKIRELGSKTSTLKFQACKIVAAGNRIVLQSEDQGGSFLEDVRA